MPLAHLDRVSAFETLRAYGGRLFCAGRHLERLAGSCAALGRALPLSAGDLRAWLEASLRESGFPEASLRASIHWADEHGGRIVVMVRSFSPHPVAWYEEGVALDTAVSRRWTLKAQDPQIKASQYASGVLAFLDKGAPAPHELLFLGPGGTVAEGTVSNIFIVKRKRLLTPSVASGILKGVTRSVVLELAAGRGWEVLETELTRHDVYTSDECFLTNTSSEVLPVVRLDGRLIGGGKPGPWTRILGQDFKKLRTNR